MGTLSHIKEKKLQNAKMVSRANRGLKKDFSEQTIWVLFVCENVQGRERVSIGQGGEVRVRKRTVKGPIVKVRVQRVFSKGIRGSHYIILGKKERGHITLRKSLGSNLVRGALTRWLSKKEIFKREAQRKGRIKGGFLQLGGVESKKGRGRSAVKRRNFTGGKNQKKSLNSERGSMGKFRQSPTKPQAWEEKRGGSGGGTSRIGFRVAPC